MTFGQDPNSLLWVSERHLRITLGSDTSLESHHRVRDACSAIRRSPPPELLDVTPAYATVLLSFDPLTLDPNRAESAVRLALSGSAIEPALPRTLIEIPVCYHGPCAPDLESLANELSLAPSDIIALHSSAEYTVHFVGFSPGFAYLGGLPASLAAPRLATPRTRVPPGSIGIAGDQTGIYPHATPGGWRLIGRTPLNIFDPVRFPPCLCALGNQVRFRPITFLEFQDAQAGGSQ